jgi:hypothetical protein
VADNREPGMSAYRLEDGIEVIGTGEGWSIWHEPATERWRFDVFGGKAHKVKPIIAREMNARHAYAAIARLWSDALSHPQLTEPVRRMQDFTEAQWPKAWLPCTCEACVDG